MAELTATLSLEELNEWKTFNTVDPIGAYRGDLQAAIIARAQVGGSLMDHIIIDPDPMTEEQRIELDKAERQALIDANLEKLKDKLHKHAKPIPKT